MSRPPARSAGERRFNDAAVDNCESGSDPRFCTLGNARLYSRTGYTHGPRIPGGVSTDAVVTERLYWGRHLHVRDGADFRL